MTTKKKIIISVILILIVVAGIKTYISGMLLYKYYLLTQMDESITDEIKKNMKDGWLLTLNSGTLPSHLAGYTLSDEDLKIFDETEGPFDLISRHSDFHEIYNPDWQKKLQEKIESATKKISNLKIETLKKDLIPSTQELMKASKDVIQPSIEESSSWSLLPSFKSIRNIARYWCVLSRVLEKNKDYDSSLLLSHSVFYMMKDFETNYKNSRSIISKSIKAAISNYACESILMWSQKPHPQSKVLSKTIAKDLLDFVKYEYPLSNALKYEEHMSDYALDAICVTFGYGMKRVKDSKYFQEEKKKLYKEPLELIDKPYIEIEKKLSKYKPANDNLDEAFKNDFSFYFQMFFNTRKKLLNTFLSMTSIDIKRAKEVYETNLAKMELTAIALAINSYYCENNKIPTSMDELSLWFGEELPINRFTGQPYELNPKGKYILYNEGTDSIKETDNFSFCFEP